MVAAIGIHEDWTATPPGRTPTQVRARYPKSKIGRVFTGSPRTTVADLRPKALATLQPYLDAGTKIIYISWKTDVTQTLNGDWNARYSELAVYLRQLEVQYGIEIIVIPWHEPEDDFASGIQYVSYYNKVYDAIKAGSADIKVKPAFLTYHWALNGSGTASIGGKTNTPNDWFNGAKYLDGIAADVYSGRSFPLEHILMEHPGFSRLVQYLPAGIRISLTERGWETPSSTNATNRSALRATTERREFDWLLSSDPVAQRIDDYVIWSSPGTENAAGLIQDAAAEAEIDRFLASHSRTTPGIPTPTRPDPTHPQYRFGFEAGLGEGKNQGRKSAYTEVRDLADSRIPKV